MTPFERTLSAPAPATCPLAPASSTGTVRRLAIAVVLLLGSLLSATTAEACRQWGASGAWLIQQTNNVEVTLDMRQEGELLTGYGKFYGRVVDPTQKDIPGSSGYRHYTGAVDMIIAGDQIEIRIFWMPGMVGIYRGTINARGRASGEHWDRDRPGERIWWNSSRLFSCVA